jgi:hypothetical protein
MDRKVMRAKLASSQVHRVHRVRRGLRVHLACGPKLRVKMAYKVLRAYRALREIQALRVP